MLYDFFDIYDRQFADCRDTGTYLRALAYLADSGDTTVVGDRLRRLEACSNISELAQAQIRQLFKRIEPQRAIASGAAASSSGVPLTEGSPSDPVVTSEQTVEPVAEPLQPTSVAEDAPADGDVPDKPHEVAAPLAQASPKIVKSKAEHQKSTLKQPHLRRTSLPVAPSLPIPSRTVPPDVLADLSIEVLTKELERPTLPISAKEQPASWSTEAGSRMVYRTGDAGTSRLFRLENTVSLGYQGWTFSATSLYLDAGGHGKSTFSGTPFRGERQRTPVTETTGFIPQIAYDSEKLDFALGATPFGGEVWALPTFRLAYTIENKLRVAVFQESVTDSLLAYTGVRDSFSGERMGRVMRSGMRIGWDDTFAEHYFYGGAATGAWLYGENVKNNSQVRGEFYFGRAFGPFAIGSYSAVDHYQTNLNHYTFGHGGYYSPDLAVSSVIFLSWEYRGKYGRIKADVSSGYLHERTQDSDIYYGISSSSPGVYRGETHERLTANTGLEGSLNLAQHLTLNSTFRIVNSGSFTETRGALQLKWEF